MSECAGPIRFVITLKNRKARFILELIEHLLTIFKNALDSHGITRRNRVLALDFSVQMKGNAYWYRLYTGFIFCGKGWFVDSKRRLVQIEPR